MCFIDRYEHSTKLLLKHFVSTEIFICFSTFISIKWTAQVHSLELCHIYKINIYNFLGEMTLKMCPIVGQSVSCIDTHFLSLSLILEIFQELFLWNVSSSNVFIFLFETKRRIPIDSLGFVDSLEQMYINKHFHTHYFPFAIDHAVEFQW